MENRIIDFHSHILPGIDDGSPNVATSIEMLETSLGQGVEVQVLTPHFYPWKESISSFCDRRERSFRRLSENVQSSPERVCGAEVAFFSHMPESDLSELCVKNTRTLLIEMPFESWNNRIIDDLSALSLDLDYRIVLAHIERFMHYGDNRQMIMDLASLPVVFQINAEAFLHFRTRKVAMDFVKSGYSVILGSDAHNCTSRRPNIKEAREFIAKRAGEEYLDKMDGVASLLLDG